MSKKKNKGVRQQKQKVLLDHKHVGKRYIPPILNIGPFHELKWIDSILPEILWLGLLNERYGVQRGAELAVGLAQAAQRVSATEHLGLTSAYSLLNQSQKDEILTILRPNHLELLKDGLSVFPRFYPECPLNFLFEGLLLAVAAPEKMLEHFKATLSTFFDKTSEPATFMQANAVYIAFATDRLRVAPHLSLANFPAIEKYPRTEESKRVASGIRSVTHLMVAGTASENQSAWSGYFWNRGLDIQPCDLEQIWSDNG